MNYTNLMGITGSGKSTFLKQYNYKSNLNFKTKLIKIYNSKSLKKVRLFSHLTTPTINIRIHKIYKRLLSERAFKLNKFDQFKYRMNLASKFHSNYLISRFRPDFIIEDEGILSFIDNFFIHPLFIYNNFDFEFVIDEIYCLPNKVIYLEKETKTLEKNYLDRLDKPWPHYKNLDLVNFFDISKKKYEIFLNVLINKYNINVTSE